MGSNPILSATPATSNLNEWANRHLRRPREVVSDAVHSESGQFGRHRCHLRHQSPFLGGRESHGRLRRHRRETRTRWLDVHSPAHARGRHRGRNPLRLRLDQPGTAASRDQVRGPPLRSFGCARGHRRCWSPVAPHRFPSPKQRSRAKVPYRQGPNWISPPDTAADCSGLPKDRIAQSRLASIRARR